MTRFVGMISSLSSSVGGGGGGSERDMRNAKAQGEAIAHRPDRFDGGGGFEIR